MAAMNLRQIREKYPQYKDVSDKDLADALYDKYYADQLERDDFYKQIGLLSAVKKAPQKPEPGFMDKLYNLEVGAARGIGDVGTTLLGMLPGLDKKSLDESLNKRMMTGVDAESPEFQAGRFGGNVGATLPVGGVLQKVAKTALPLIGNVPKIGAGYKAFTESLNAPGGLSLFKNAPDAATRALQITGDVGGRAVTGATTASLIDPTEESAALGAGANILLPDALRLASKPINAIGRSIGNAFRPFLPGGAEKNAGMLARKVAGEKTDDVISALEQAKRGETAAQASVPAGSAEFAALEDTARKYKPTPFTAIDKAQESARRSALEQITPNLDEAIAARSAATKPLYTEADESVVALAKDSGMTRLLQRMPTNIVGDAKETARIAGRPFIYKTGKNQAEISGESLGYIKTELDKAIQNETGKRQAELMNLRDAFLKEFEGIVPSYGAAREAFKEFSVPVNQASVLQEAGKVLSGQGGPERVGPFMNTLGRGEEALLKKSTGSPRFTSMEEVLSPEQMQVMRNIEGEFTRDIEKARLAQAGSPKTNKMISEYTNAIDMPSFLNRMIMIGKVVLKEFEGVGAERTLNSLSDLMQNPRALAEVMRRAAPQDRAMLQRLVNSKTAPVLGATMAREDEGNQ